MIHFRIFDKNLQNSIGIGTAKIRFIMYSSYKLLIIASFLIKIKLWAQKISLKRA